VAIRLSKFRLSSPRSLFSKYFSGLTKFIVGLSSSEDEELLSPRHPGRKALPNAKFKELRAFLSLRMGAVHSPAPREKCTEFGLSSPFYT
jgi:hypothetical protein